MSATAPAIWPPRVRPGARASSGAGRRPPPAPRGSPRDHQIEIGDRAGRVRAAGELVELLDRQAALDVRLGQPRDHPFPVGVRRQGGARPSRAKSATGSTVIEEARDMSFDAPWGRRLAGRLDEHVIDSEVLRGEPRSATRTSGRSGCTCRRATTMDPDRRYPAVYVIQGFTGQLDMWRNRSRSGRSSRRRSTRSSRDGEAPPCLRRLRRLLDVARRQPVRRLARPPAATTPTSATRSCPGSTPATARSPRPRTAASPASRAAATAR